MAEAGDRGTPWVDGLTVGAVSRETAARYPASDAVVFPALGLRWSWRELDRRVDAVASALIARGVGPGEHVGIWSMNAPEWVVTQFAVGRIGAVLVNINPAYRLHELEETLRAADVATLIVGAPFKGSDFVADGRDPLPRGRRGRVARLVRRPGCPRLRRLVALGDRPGPGLARLGRPRGGGRSSPRAGRSRGGGRGRATSTTSSSPRGRPACPRGRCSRTATC